MVSYPKPVKTRSGYKVGWLYFKTESEAKIASSTARERAKLQISRGYDFGYLSPGTITLCQHGNYKGLWEVVIP